MPKSSLNTLSDLLLVSLIDDGNENAFKELYDRHWRKLYNQAYKRLDDMEKCKDIVQDVFLQFWQKGNRSHVLNVQAYLIQSVRYHVIKVYNESKKQVSFELPLELIEEPQIEIEEVFFAKELQAYIDAWLSLQPDKRREIFRLRFIEDKSTREISDLLGISQKTVQKTLFVALNSLKESLGGVVAYFPLIYLLYK